MIKAGGGSSVVVRQRVGGLNPFRAQDEAELLQERTHNHRR